MIKFNHKGFIIQGDYSPYGEIIVKDDTEDTGGYYIYIWPKDGSNWANSDKEMIYDVWLENRAQLTSYFNNRKWVIKWE